MASHSNKTLLQLMARAGRPGVSHTAIIYAGDRILDVINNSIYNPEYEDIEVSNFELSVQQAKDLHEQQILQELERIRLTMDEDDEDDEDDEEARLKKEQARLRSEEQARLRSEEEKQEAIYFAEQKLELEELRTLHDSQLNSRWRRPLPQYESSSNSDLRRDPELNTRWRRNQSLPDKYVSSNTSVQRKDIL